MYVPPNDRVGLASDGWWRRCCYGCHGCCGTLDGPYESLNEAISRKGLKGGIRDRWEVKWPKDRRYRSTATYGETQ